MYVTMYDFEGSVVARAVDDAQGHVWVHICQGDLRLGLMLGAEQLEAIATACEQAARILRDAEAGRLGIDNGATLRPEGEPLTGAQVRRALQPGDMVPDCDEGPTNFWGAKE